MLVFVRKLGESFYIGEDVEITILDVDSHQVKVSVNAPRNIPIIRKELLENDTATQNRKDVAILIDSLKRKQKKEA